MHRNNLRILFRILLYVCTYKFAFIGRLLLKILYILLQFQTVLEFCITNENLFYKNKQFGTRNNKKLINFQLKILFPIEITYNNFQKS